MPLAWTCGLGRNPRLDISHLAPDFLNPTNPPSHTPRSCSAEHFLASFGDSQRYEQILRLRECLYFEANIPTSRLTAVTLLLFHRRRRCETIPVPWRNTLPTRTPDILEIRRRGQSSPSPSLFLLPLDIANHVSRRIPRPD